MNIKSLVKANNSIMQKQFEELKKSNNSKIVTINIDLLHINPYQPRIEIKKKELEELANSIKEQGLIQPVILTKREEGGYFIVAGHRRVEAHKLLGKEKIKAIVLDTNNETLSTLALIENLQRKDLDIIETALALKNHKERTGKTLEEIGKEIGKNKDYVSRMLNILQLPDEIINDLQKNKSTKDVKALSEINSFAKKIKKLATPTFNRTELDNLQKSLYYGLLKNGRKWLESEIKRKLSLIEQEKEDKLPIKIKKDKRRGVIINVRMPNLDDEKIEKIEKAIRKILEEMQNA